MNKERVGGGEREREREGGRESGRERAGERERERERSKWFFGPDDGHGGYPA